MVEAAAAAAAAVLPLLLLLVVVVIVVVVVTWDGWRDGREGRGPGGSSHHDEES